MAHEFREMIGTEKQIEWAKKIRPALFDEVALRLTHGTEAVAAGPKAAEIFRSIILNALAFQSKASFWIDRRGNCEQTIIDLTKSEARKLTAAADEIAAAKAAFTARSGFRI